MGAQILDPGAFLFGDESLQHGPEPGHRLLPGAGIGLGQLLAQRVEQFGFHLGARRRQAKQPLPPIAIARPGFDQIAARQFVEHATQRLFGDRQERQQFADRHVWLARHEIERTVMGTAQPLRGEAAIDRAHEVTIAEIQQFHTPAEFGLAEKLCRCGLVRGSHVDPSRHRA